MIITYCLFTKKLLQKYQINIYTIKKRLFDFKCFPLLLLGEMDHGIRVSLE